MALFLAGCDEPTSPSTSDNRQFENASELLDSAPEALSNIDDSGMGVAEPDDPGNATDEESR